MTLLAETLSLITIPSTQVAERAQMILDGKTKPRRSLGVLEDLAVKVAGIRIMDAMKDVMIMLLPMLGVLALVIVWPELVLFLPKLFPPGTL